MKKLLIIPAHNEEKNLERLLPKLKVKLASFDLLVVDDASSDRTTEIARRENVFCLVQKVNLGIGGSVQTGMKFALENNYDLAVQFDGDGQHRADEVENLILPIMDDCADMVVGSRYLEDKGYKTPIARRIGMIFSAWLTSIIIKQKLTDITSGFRAWNRKALRVFASDYPASFPGVESSIHGFYKGLRILEVPSKFEQRLSGKSSINFWKSFYYPFKTIIAAISVLLRSSSSIKEL